MKIMVKQIETYHKMNIVIKCFQYAVTVALNYEKIESRPKRALNTKPFINKCNWKVTTYQ